MYTVKELRKKEKITPPQMASTLGLSLSSYFDKEAGRRKFQPHEIIEICMKFDVRVEEVIDFYSRSTRNENSIA